MSSITSWTRLEPVIRCKDIPSLQAKIHDPLWLLARQWQLGEFKGEDAGSPVIARLEAKCSRLTRYYPGPLTGNSRVIGQKYDSNSIPLETLVECEQVNRIEVSTDERKSLKGNENLRLAAETGLQFLRSLNARGVEIKRNGWAKLFSFNIPAQEQTMDSKSRLFFSTIKDRVPNGFTLYQRIKNVLSSGTDEVDFYRELEEKGIIKHSDREGLIEAAREWSIWFESLYSEPMTESNESTIESSEPVTRSSWMPERMEYAAAVSAPRGIENGDQEETVLVSPEYTEGHLDWYSFNILTEASLGAEGDKDGEKEIVHTAVPAPISYKGMPASRWWEMEDGQINFGNVKAAAEDLARLLLIEFAITYGNDWFVIPVDLDVGSICRISSLVITDTFGERTLINHYSNAYGGGPTTKWHMFRLSLGHSSSENTSPDLQDFLFLPPTLVSSLHSSPVEEVLFLRDEMANMAWAVERVVESNTGKPLNRLEIYQEQLNKELGEPHTSESTEHPAAPFAYRLISNIPDFWIPLVPVPEGVGSIRLERGSMLECDGSIKPVKPLGRILEPDIDLRLHEEEVPREGIQVTRTYQYTRWVDGSTHLWVGRRKRPGTSEGSSGLRFDIIEPA